MKFSKWNIVILFALISLSLFACKAQNAKIDDPDLDLGKPGGQCYADNTCDAGAICIDDKCVAIEEKVCSADSDCTEGKICLEGKCGVKPLEEFICKSDLDCIENPDGDRCVEGKCQPHGDPIFCDKAEDCQSPYICKGGICQFPEGKSCQADVDCAEGLVCTDSICVEKPPAPVLGDIGAACETNENCMAHMICQDKLCTWDPNYEIEFEDKNFEAAIRAELAFKDDYKIRVSDLLKVTELSIYDDETILSISDLKYFLKLNSFNFYNGVFECNSCFSYTPKEGAKGVTKISGLEHLTLLKTLRLNGTLITKIEGLGGLTNLEELYLSGNPITKIEGLDSLSNLHSLDLSTTLISKIENLTSLKELNTLYLDNNKILEIEGLEKLTKLQKLVLNSNKITKIEGLEFLSELQDLYLGNNKISLIEGLNGLSKLQRLRLDWNQITKIEGLDALAKLTELGLSINKITKIEGLDKLAQLTELYLYNNQIKDFSKFSAYSQAGIINKGDYINISDNPGVCDITVMPFDSNMALSGLIFLGINIKTNCSNGINYFH